MIDMRKLELKLRMLIDRRCELFELKKPIDAELVRNHDRIAKIKDEIGKTQLKSMGKVDWKLLLEEGNGTAIHERFHKELMNRGLWDSGYLIDTGQRCVQVKLIKGSKQSYNTTVAALKEILPFIKPRSSDTDPTVIGYKFIDIFESTLSANGSYYMLIKPHEYRLMCSRWHRAEELKKFASLEGIIKYIQEHHPYE